MIHVMDVYLNYVTVLMEYVILKTNVKKDWTVLSVTKLAVKDTLVTTVMIHVMDVYLNYVTVLMEYVISKAYAKQDGTMLSVTKNAPQVDMVSTVTPIV